jgi:hypothetical protein
VTDDLQRSLGRVESKVDMLLALSEAYEKRLHAVEKKVWYASGVSAVLAFIATHILGRQ